MYKDYFTGVAQNYAQYRPAYPMAMIEFVLEHTQGRTCAWDCATGSGQIAGMLAGSFTSVHASDISSEQLQHAQAFGNVYYSEQPAEKTNFESDSFDLITVGQAAHWLNLEKFYAEARRVAKPNATIAMLTYNNSLVNKEIDKVVYDFQYGLLRSYWDSARVLVEQAYVNLPFPFNEVPCGIYNYELEWTAEHMLGYLGSWSAVHRYNTVHSSNCITLIEPRLRGAWGNGLQQVRFPCTARIGKINIC